MIHSEKILKLANRIKPYWLRYGAFLNLLVMLCICILYAIKARHYVDFSPLNGTFQNFNPVRRLLNGQVPYRDFIDYLGLGHLYSGAVMTYIFGSDFNASLIAFSFLSIFSLAAMSALIGFAILREGAISIAVTNLLLLMLLVKDGAVFTYLFGWINGLQPSLKQALTMGNSARFVRALILPIVTGLIVFLGKIFTQAFKHSSIQAFKHSSIQAFKHSSIQAEGFAGSLYVQLARLADSHFAGAMIMA